MAKRVVLHIGMMKSGTSYVQSMLFSQRQQLAAAGVLVPGGPRSQHEPLRQGRLASGPRDEWYAVLRKLREHPGVVVLSSELLAAAVPQMARNLLPDLAPAPVDIVVTARDLNRTLVSSWQETLQNGRTWTWDEYYASASATAPYTGARKRDPDSPGRSFWRQQDLALVVGQVIDLVGAGRVTVVTVPPSGSGSEVLPIRFADATGIPLETGTPPPRVNASLGLASALALRELNELLAKRDRAWPFGSILRKRVLAKQVLAGIAVEEPRLGLDPEEWVREQTAATVASLRTTGVRIVGRWSDLDPVPVPGVRPEDVDPALITRAALAGLAGIVVHQAEGRGEAVESPAD